MSRKYLEYVASLPCCLTGFQGEGVQAHHIIGHNAITGKGMAKKGSDLTAIPLNHVLHRELHDMGWKTFENLHNFSQLEVMVKTILQAEKEGEL